uniref:Uncharacterized protein n=1 Tax=Acrobeloides nanus TaxID=290746 RepID=A0A914CKT4_9BILA
MKDVIRLEPSTNGCDMPTCGALPMYLQGVQVGLAVLAIPTSIFVIGAIYEKPTCASVTCNKNESCIMQEVICVRAPCYPVPTCVPKNHHCALKNCSFNQVPNEEQEDV